MAETVTGSLTDFGDVVIPAGLRPELWFKQDGAAVSRASSRLYPRSSVRATLNPATGAWMVSLAATGDLRPKLRFRPIIKYFRADGSFHSQDLINVPFPVPVGGGTLAEILDLPIEPGSIVVGVGIPDATPGVLAVDLAGDAEGFPEFVFERKAYL